MNIFKKNKDIFNLDNPTSINVRHTVFTNDFHNFVRYYKLNDGSLTYFWGIVDMILVYIKSDDVVNYINFLFLNNYNFGHSLLSDICVLNKNINLVVFINEQ